MDQIHGIKGIKGLYNSGIKIFIMLAILLPPYIVNKYATVDMIVNILRIILVVIIFIDYLMKNKISKFFCLEVCIWVSYLIYCIVNRSFEYHVLVDILTIFALTALTESCFVRGNDRYFYKGLRILLLTYLIANTVTIFMSNFDELRATNGSFEVRAGLFLGFDNDYAMALIPLIGVLLFDRHTKKIDFFICTLAFIDFLISFSGSGIICFSILFVYCFARHHFTLPKWIKSWNILLCVGFVFVLIYVFQVQRLFSFLFVNILGKDVTMTGRTVIWNYILKAIKNSWVIGYGNFSNNQRYLSQINEYSQHAPHNIFLHFMLMGGVVGLILFVSMIIYSFKKIDKSSKHGNNNSALPVALLCYLLCGMVASYYALEEFSVLLAVAYIAGKDHKFNRNVEQKKFINCDKRNL